MQSEPALSLDWVFSFNEKIAGGVQSLCTDQRQAVFYIAAHTGVIYDYTSRTQQLLQGHRNPITCCAVSRDKKWIVTADAGEDSVLVVWDSMTGTPIKTIFSPHPSGVLALDISSDSLYIATISQVEGEGSKQQIGIWEWTEESGTEAVHLETIPSRHTQICIKFNPESVHELMTNGTKHVTFWSWDGEAMGFYTPRLSSEAHHGTDLTVSCFIEGTSLALTATADGKVIMWDNPYIGTTAMMEGPPQKVYVKSIQLTQGWIAHLSSIYKYVCVAGEDGAVRFYDLQLRIEGWFEDLKAGPVSSVSFAYSEPAQTKEERGGFYVPDFLVGTQSGYIVGLESCAFEEIDAENRRGVLLVQGLNDEVHGLATHPKADRLAISCYNCTLQLWDYNNKVLLMLRSFDKPRLRPQCMMFDPQGNVLFVGTTTGQLKVLDGETLNDITTFEASEHTIVMIRCSVDGKYFACVDSASHVALWVIKSEAEAKSNMPNRSPKRWGPERAWTFLGRNKSHSRKITGLEFVRRENGRDTLVSVGEDRRIVEYDLMNSSVEKGLCLYGLPCKVEQIAQPSACMWHPRFADDYEDRIIVANTEFKFKQFNADDLSCRSTCLGPTFGGPVNRLISLPAIAETGETFASDYVTYSTASRVLGLVKLPLDGSPDKWMGLIAHPTDLTCIAVSRDGAYVFSAGGADRTVNVWGVNVAALDAAEESGGGGIGPYLRLLEGGEGGELHRELQDYFYYTQLRIQGEDTTSERQANGLIPVTEVALMMRALGFFPTDMEIQNMIKEVKYRDFTRTGELVESIDLETFIKLYVNHRPVADLDKQDIDKAFSVLGGDSQLILESDNLIQRLQSQGEPLSDQELKSVLNSLTGEAFIKDPTMSSTSFCTEVLGFEDPNNKPHESPLEPFAE